MHPADLPLLKENTMDFLAISYYYSRIVDASKNTMAPFDGEQNPYLKPTAWEWRADPLGFTIAYLNTGTAIKFLS